MTDPHVSPCAYDEAKQAVLSWHYSARMPRGRSAHYGVRENGEFTGAVVFGVGATKEQGRPYGLTNVECWELTRVALSRHLAPVSQILARAIRLLRRDTPALRLLVSYADPAHGHHGGIYQAGGWVYAGTTAPGREVLGPDGVWRHPRSHRHKYATQRGFDFRATPPKHRYLMPLDRRMRRQVLPLSRPKPAPAAPAQPPPDGPTPC